MTDEFTRNNGIHTRFNAPEINKIKSESALAVFNLVPAINLNSLPLIVGIS